jgi:hypothetical protein
MGIYRTVRKVDLTKITIVPLLTNRYEKISAVVVFDAPKIFLGEKHRSRSGAYQYFTQIQK